MRGSKIPVQELWLKMGGGRIREGGARNSGILRYMHTQKLRQLETLVVWRSTFTTAKSIFFAMFHSIKCRVQRVKITWYDKPLQ